MEQSYERFCEIYREGVRRWAPEKTEQKRNHLTYSMSRGQGVQGYITEKMQTPHQPDSTKMVEENKEGVH